MGSMLNEERDRMFHRIVVSCIQWLTVCWSIRISVDHNFDQSSNRLRDLIKLLRADIAWMFSRLSLKNLKSFLNWLIRHSLNHLNKFLTPSTVLRFSITECSRWSKAAFTRDAIRIESRSYSSLVRSSPLSAFSKICSSTFTSWSTKVWVMFGEINPLCFKACQHSNLAENMYWNSKTKDILHNSGDKILHWTAVQYCS